MRYDYGYNTQEVFHLFFSSRDRRESNIGRRHRRIVVLDIGYWKIGKKCLRIDTQRLKQAHVWETIYVKITWNMWTIMRAFIIHFRFLHAFSHIYKRVCPSLRPSVTAIICALTQACYPYMRTHRWPYASLSLCQISVVISFHWKPIAISDHRGSNWRKGRRKETTAKRYNRYCHIHSTSLSLTLSSALRYHQFKQMLQVHIDRAEGLPSCNRVANRWDEGERDSADKKSTTDPFIKLQILPEKRLKVFLNSRNLSVTWSAVPSASLVSLMLILMLVW